MGRFVAMTPLDHYALWTRTLGQKGDQDDALLGPREQLRTSFLSFRERAGQLVSTLAAELPGLTVHDITHLDGLWRIANAIAGNVYPINPAEAYVLGGAFLLHDAAHVVAAYPGRMNDIRVSTEWRDYVGQRLAGQEPERGSAEELVAQFAVLRHLHAKQALRLPGIMWRASGSDVPSFLIENAAIRDFYGELIGEISASHHWSAAKVASHFEHRKLFCPAFLAPADWEVDALKIALLLRTADAAHLDADRAPWFLFALRQPRGISEHHWRFQAKMAQPTCGADGRLRFTSGSSFGPQERAAWWLAYDAANVVDRELDAAEQILRESGRQPFMAQRVGNIESPKNFSRTVPVKDWEPLDVRPKIGDPARLISTLGGSALYGHDYHIPLRELLQNGMDAVKALRALGGTSSEEGYVKVGVRPVDAGSFWLEVTDTGIGMSRYVLSDTLLDFGHSLWTSDSMRDELPGLAARNFQPVGKFGIGFYSVFMLGSRVTVTTRRHQMREDESEVDWQLVFDQGLSGRPAVVKPSEDERLARPGTRVAVLVQEVALHKFLETGTDLSTQKPVDPSEAHLRKLVASIVPTSEVKLITEYADHAQTEVVHPGDWCTVPDEVILGRIGAGARRLYPVIADDGRVIARVTVADNSYSSAMLCFGGLRCGVVADLVGVACANGNNQDAQRVKANPAGKVSEWQQWAKLILTEQEKALNIRQLELLHPFVPAADLQVWRLAGQVYSLSELMQEISGRTEVLVHFGEIEHDNDDDVGRPSFYQFRPVDNLLCVPHSMRPWRGERNISSALGLPAIDYLSKLTDALKIFWAPLEVQEDESTCVGHAGGTEIYRNVHIISHSESLPSIWPK